MSHVVIERLEGIVMEMDVGSVTTSSRARLVTHAPPGLPRVQSTTLLSAAGSVSRLRPFGSCRPHRVRVRRGCQLPGTTRHQMRCTANDSSSTFSLGDFVCPCVFVRARPTPNPISGRCVSPADDPYRSQGHRQTGFTAGVTRDSAGMNPCAATGSRH
jgi:hypothetical protein